MNRIMKWMLPATTSVGLVIGLSAFATSAGEKAGDKSSATKTESKGIVSGRLMDKDGHGVAGAQVSLGKPLDGAAHPQKPQAQATEQKPAPAADQEPATTTDKKPAAPTAKRDPVATTTTDREGKFTFKNVTPGNYTVRTQMAVARVSVAAGKTADVAMTLKPAPGGGVRNKQSPKPPLTPEKQAQRDERKAERKTEKKALKSQV
jgi:hypothetical protein